MDFKLVVLVLLTYYIRPQDWVGGMSGINIMKPLMALTLFALFTRRRGFSMSSLVRTPLDWAVVAYGAYIIFTAPSGQRPLTPIVILLAYYFVTSQALSTPRRLAIYLRCWLGAILVVAGMAVLSMHGLDLTGAKDLTNVVPDKPRLVLNTYLFKNANSLGHTVVIAIALSYLLLFWKRPLPSKIVAAVAIALAAYCVYLTKSKGAYLVGASLLVAAVIIGRHRIFQLICLLLAATVGWTGLSQLPRMAGLETARRDEAIMGRMLAWEQARRVSKESSTGEGFKNFRPMIIFEEEEINKATHSSYVLIGAELGPTGMLFFLGVLYCSIRILLTARCTRIEDERSRKAMFILLLAYLLSGWLIDRSYHMEYFLLAGAVAAFHRRLGVEAGILEPDTGAVENERYLLEGGEEEETDQEEKEQELELDPEPAPVRDGPPDEFEEEPRPSYTGPDLAYAKSSSRSSNPHGRQGFSALEEVDTSEVAEEAIEEALTERAYWRKFGIVDILLVLLFSRIVFEVWDYLLKIYFEY